MANDKNRQQAINWLVEKVSKWPRPYKGLISAPIGWVWFNFGDGELSLVSKWNKPIHKADWIHFINVPRRECNNVY